MEASIKDHIETAIAYHFSNPDLLLQALTHRTWIEERYPGGASHQHMHEANGRLEFLGDALLTYIAGQWVYDKLPHAPEGDLTRIRTAVVDKVSLDQKARELGLLPDHLRLGRGERQNVIHNKVILGDTLEAIIGAVLLDGGPQAASALVQKLLPPEPPQPRDERDPIPAFNEWFQKTHRASPPRPSWSWTGPENERTWICTLEFGDHQTQAQGADKKGSQRDATRRMLALLGVPGWGAP